MKEEDQRIAIAEACGWTRHIRPREDDLGPIGDLKEECWYHDSLDELTKCQKGMWAWPIKPPDYCSDLNAMHEAEKTLGGENWITYENHLRDSIFQELWDDPKEGGRVNVWHATAQQRAEAFLRTINLWKD